MHPGKDRRDGRSEGRATHEELLAALEQADEDLERVNASAPGPVGSEAEQLAWASPGPEKRADGGLRGAPDYRRMRPLTAKQLSFARGVIEGLGLRAAYRQAYGTTASDEAVSVAATRLSKNARVRAIIQAAWDETQEALVEDQAAARRYVLKSLVEMSKGTSDTTRLRALEMLGKASGAFTPAPAERDRTASPDALRRDLAQHLRLVAGKTGTDAG